MNLERELRRTLQRKDPPPGFERRVLTRLARGETVASPPGRLPWRRFALPLAASLVMIVGASYVVHVREQQQAREQWLAGARATSEVARALSIASERWLRSRPNSGDQPTRPVDSPLARRPRCWS
jgi:hypothetical protein